MVKLLALTCTLVGVSDVALIENLRSVGSPPDEIVTARY
jgi:hypothetical protein